MTFFVEEKISANNKPAESQGPSGLAENQAFEINTFTERLAFSLVTFFLAKQKKVTSCRATPGEVVLMRVKLNQPYELKTCGGSPARGIHPTPRSTPHPQTTTLGVPTCLHTPVASQCDIQHLRAITRGIFIVAQLVTSIHTSSSNSTSRSMRFNSPHALT